MPSKVLSVILVILCTFFASLIGRNLFSNPRWIIAAAGSGFFLGLATLALMKGMLKLEAERIIGGAIGLLGAALLGIILTSGMYASINRTAAGLPLYALGMTILCLVGLQLGASKAKDLKKRVETTTEPERKIVGILDTSVIIDGRIADVCETGFIDGDLIIPQFVLNELQAIADSSESTKRTRGRRGLDILNKIQKQSYVKIIIDDTDYPSIKEVDQKLIHIAKDTGNSILTNDFNLNKVAQVHSIQVLNINQLANALKPIVLPGEAMKVQILKEGKEAGQGVAYLDDGTMVVVDNGRKQIGKNVEVTVTSVLQSTAGRMIFAIMKT
ncbi:MAG: TRAM domain-containing protein [Desulfomonilaceae bacterium]